MKKLGNLAVFALAAAFLLAGIGSTANATGDKKSPHVERGRKLFMQYCASCHGADAKGAGPVAIALKGGPPDLTAIQAPDRKFPFYRIETVIDGEKDVPAHGTRKMPVWGSVLRRTSGELQKQAEIYALVKYIESIQAQK